MNRAKTAVLNSSLSVVTLIVTTMLQFIYRTVLVHSLGITYAGVTGLCMNLIGIFALSELGISWAISYYLYKPLKNNDNYQVAEIVFFLKKLYKYVGAFILVSGTAITPFLDTLVKGGNDVPHFKLIFLIFVFNTAISYLFFSYYQILANADRKNYVLFVPQVLGQIILVISQILVICYLHSFIVVVILSCVSTVVVNYVIRYKILRLYPYLKEYKNIKINLPLRAQITRYIKSTMLYKISLTVQSSSTSIIISYFIGLVVLGIYSNYMLIVDSIRSLILSSINPMVSVIGEITTDSKASEKHVLFKRLNFIMCWICYFCSISLYCLLTPFVSIWVGSNVTLPHTTIIIICVYFYIEFIISFSTQFRSACGLNDIGKFRPLITTIINVLLAILLVHKWGLNGILIALLLSRLATLTWFEPLIVHKYVFNKPIWPYYRTLIINFIFVVVIAVLTKWSVQLIWDDSISSFILALLICLTFPNLVFLAIYGRTQEFKYFLSKLSAKLRPKT